MDLKRGAMKKPVELNQASRLVNCGMLILVTAAIRDKATITPCAWHMPVSKEPPLVAIALAKKHFSSEAIQESKEFIINIPQWHMLNQIMACGSVSARDAGDKFSLARLTKDSPHSLTVTPAINECIGDLECRLKECRESGDHLLFTGEVVYAQVQSDYFMGGFWDTRRAKLIFHLGGKAFFASTFYNEFLR
jgi:flavin reductase (DIM6/NTAB) family NADH-FMN oxidoreductase RutF